MTPRPPDFLCIGAAKAGTTWLYRVLRSCPGYWMPPVKELRYLMIRERQTSDDPRARKRLNALTEEIHKRAGTASSETVAAEDRAWFQHYVFGEPKDDDWYFGLFSPAGDRITGDISPGYAGLSDARAVCDFLPDARVVFIVRNPVERDLSHALHHAHKRALGAPKAWVLARYLAGKLALPGNSAQQVEVLRKRYGIPPATELDVSELLDAHNRETGENIKPDDLRGLLGADVSRDDVRALVDAPGMAREQRQSETIRLWRAAFGDRFHVFLFDDLVADPRGFLHDVTAALSRVSVPGDASLLSAKFNPGIYSVPGLDDLRNELRQRCAAEIDALQDLLGDRAAAWRGSD